MKKLTITLFVIVAAMAASGQKLSLTTIDTTTTVKDFEMEVVRECLWQYQRQHNISYFMGLGGTAMVVAGVSTDNTIVYATGGVLMVGAIINMVASEKWLRRAAIRPIPSGIAIRLPSK